MTTFSSNGTLYGIGVGPGEPELMTSKAIETIRACDSIIFPSEPIEDCYAYKIVKRMLPDLDEKELIAIEFPMIRDENRLNEAHDRIADQVEEMLKEGRDVAFVTIGDPSVYSTFTYLHRRITARGFVSKIISGVPSFCAAAARLGIPLGERSEQIHIVPGAYDVNDTMHLSGTRVYMKSGKRLGQLKEMLEKEIRIRELEIYTVANCGMENERVGSGIESINPDSGYLTLVIVKTGKMPEDSSRFFANRACQYYPCHKNIEHINCMFCYCPMYEITNCPGTPEYIEREGQKIKVCTNCIYPHKAENYDNIMKVLSHRIKGEKHKKSIDIV